MFSNILHVHQPVFNHEDPPFSLNDLHISWNIRLPVYYQHGLTVHCCPDFLWWSYYPRFGQGEQLCLCNIPIIFHIYPILKTAVHPHRFPHTFLTVPLFFFFSFTAGDPFHFRHRFSLQSILCWTCILNFNIVTLINILLYSYRSFLYLV